jgi:hypothetical protein
VLPAHLRSLSQTTGVEGFTSVGRFANSGCVPKLEPFRLWPVIGSSFNITGRLKMRSLILAVCCAALVGSLSVASAQTTGPAGQEAMKANDPLNANAKTMKKKHKAKKSMTKSDDSMSKDGMKKDTK